MVPKMTEIAGAQGSESARQLVASQHAADSSKAMVDADTREVHTKKDVQAVTMRTDRERDAEGRDRRGKKRGAGGGGQRGGGAGADKAREARTGEVQGSFIDVRL